MADRPSTILICSCEDTMPLDRAAVERGCRGAKVLTGRQLCRAELEKFRAAAAGDVPLIVGCTQEAPLFAETAEGADVTYANIRETAGWSKDASAAGRRSRRCLRPREPMPETPFISFTSEGVALIYGRDEQAIEAGRLLKDHLDVTVLIKPPADVTPPRVTDFPVVKGTIRSAKGHLGAFELTVDDYAQPAPSSRGKLVFSSSRDGAVSHCDLVLDLSGGTPLFTASDLRDGYLRADPGDGAAVLKAVLAARDLVGTFDKPRYVDFTAELCTHSRSGIVGCTRCLDLCQTGAITPAGDHVAIDALSARAAAMCRRLPDRRAILRTALGGCADAQATGTPDDLSRCESATAAAPAHSRRHPRHAADRCAGAFWRRLACERLAARGERSDASGPGGRRRCLRLWGICGALSAPREAAARHCGPDEDARAGGADPRWLGLRRGARRHDRDRRPGDARHDAPRSTRLRQHRARELPGDRKRDVMRLALRELTAAPAPIDVVALPLGTFGKIESTLRLHALPRLRELSDRCASRQSGAADASVRGGRLRAVRALQGDLSEKVITLHPQLDSPRAATATDRVLKEEAVRLHPLQAVRRQEHDRARHRQAEGALDVPEPAERLDIIKMCEDCRVVAISEQQRPLRRAGAAEAAYDRGLFARARNAIGRTRRTHERCNMPPVLKRVRTKVLEIAYGERPAGGIPVLLMHGWPYDPRTYDDVVPQLVARLPDDRALPARLRSTRFLSADTPRSASSRAWPRPRSSWTRSTSGVRARRLRLGGRAAHAAAL